MRNKKFDFVSQIVWLLGLPLFFEVLELYIRIFEVWKVLVNNPDQENGKEDVEFIVNGFIICAR